MFCFNNMNQEEQKTLAQIYKDLNTQNSKPGVVKFGNTMLTIYQEEFHPYKNITPVNKIHQNRDNIKISEGKTPNSLYSKEFTPKSNREALIKTIEDQKIYKNLFKKTNVEEIPISELKQENSGIKRSMSSNTFCKDRKLNQNSNNNNNNSKKDFLDPGVWKDQIGVYSKVPFRTTSSYQENFVKPVSTKKIIDDISENKKKYLHTHKIQTDYDWKPKSEYQRDYNGSRGLSANVYKSDWNLGRAKITLK